MGVQTVDHVAKIEFTKWPEQARTSLGVSRRAQATTLFIKNHAHFSLTFAEERSILFQNILASAQSIALLGTDGQEHQPESLVRGGLVPLLQRSKTGIDRNWREWPTGLEGNATCLTTQCFG